MAKFGPYVWGSSPAIGKGSFGEVFKGRDKDTGEAVAVKELLYERVQKRHAIKEVQTLIKLNHPNVLRILAAFENVSDQNIPKGIGIVTEFCSNGTLSDLLRKNPGVIKSNNRLEIFIQLMSGLSYMHREGFAHRDIKPDNILVDGRFCVKIADFGLAKLLFRSNMQLDQRIAIYMETLCGCRPYMAPEVFRGHYTTKSDIFSMGLVIFVICELPQALTPQVEVVNGGAVHRNLGEYMDQEQKKGRQIEMLPLDLLGARSCDPFEREMINKMLQPNYKIRPQANIILQQLQAQQQ